MTEKLQLSSGHYWTGSHKMYSEDAHARQIS